MHPHTLDRLEFSQLKALLRERLTCTPGQRALEELAPSNDAHWIVQELERVAEARLLLDDGEEMGFADVSDPAAWLALTYRGRLIPGETVAVLAASGAVGQIAVQAARVLGAGRVIAAARGDDVETLAQRLGADAAVALDDESSALSDRFRDAAPCGLDLIIARCGDPRRWPRSSAPTTAPGWCRWARRPPRRQPPPRRSRPGR